MSIAAVLSRTAGEWMGFATRSATAPRLASTFEQAILPHLDAAYGLARVLTRNGAVAEDVVQDACLRALRYFKTFRGENPRAWFLQIVRNTAHATAPRFKLVSMSDGDGEHEPLEIASVDPGPEAALAAEQVRAGMREAVENLPANLRECLVLREMEDLPYAEIAQIVGVPIGTVMSRLFRARRLLMTPETAALR